MRAGGGKQKGSAFEREVCTALSLWVSYGKHKDCFWRSAISGGRATMAFKRGEKLRRVAGDICATGPEGHALTDHYYIECKHYKALGIDRFIVCGTGKIGAFWRRTCKEASKYGRKPILIARQNGMPTLMIARRGVMLDLVDFDFPGAGTLTGDNPCFAYLFDEVVQTPFRGGKNGRPANRRIKSNRVGPVS